MPCLLLLNQIPDYHDHQGQNNQTDYNINSVQSISSFPVLSEKPDYNSNGYHHQNADSGQYNHVNAVQCHFSFYNYNLVLLQRNLCFYKCYRTYNIRNIYGIINFIISHHKLLSVLRTVFLLQLDQL